MGSMIDLLHEYNIPFKQHGEQDHHLSRGWVQMDCPFCSPRGNIFRLGFHLSSKHFNCWTCGGQYGPNVLEKLLGVPYKAAITLWEGLGLTLGETEASEGRSGVLKLPHSLGPLLKQHKEYLIARGFDPEEIVEKWKVQGIGHSARLAWRIFIPVFFAGEIASWTTRSIKDDVKLRYISAKAEEEKYPLKTMLYGEWHCKHTIIVNEGPLDAWTIGKGAVATCGVGYSRAQLLRISAYPVRVIVFDNEPAAQRRAKKLCDDLASFDGETFNVVFSGKDASRSPLSEVEELRKRFL